MIGSMVHSRKLLPLLLALAACPSGNGGDADAGQADSDAETVVGGVGEPCEIDADCPFSSAVGRVVCLRYSWGFRDGYCTVMGTTQASDCTTVDPESKHVQLPCARPVCMARCEAAEDCREGYECLPSLKTCWPRCEPGRACPLPPPIVCELNDECNDGDPCTIDGCVDDVCGHTRIAQDPSVLTYLATRGPALDVDLTGRVGDNNLGLLVAEGDEGVEAIDLTNPVEPAVAYRLETAGRAVSVALRTDYIAVAEEEAGLQVFPAGGGAATGQVLVADGIGLAVGVNAENNFLYAFGDGVFQMNLAGPAIGTRRCDTRGRAMDGAWFDTQRILVVADGAAGMAVCSWPEVDAGDPSQIERVNSAGRILAVASRDTVLVAAEAGAGVSLWEVTDPAAPTRRWPDDDMGPQDLGAEATDVKMTGPGTFIASASEAGVFAFALEDCYIPTLWYHWQTEGPALALDVQEGVLAVAEAEAGVELLDIGCREPTE